MSKNQHSTPTKTINKPPVEILIDEQPIYHQPYFNLLNSLPQFIGVRNKNLDLLFLNNAASNNALLVSSMMESQKVETLGYALRQKAALLFESENKLGQHHFDLTIKQQTFHVHQAISELPDKSSVIVETVNIQQSSNTTETNPSKKQHIYNQNLSITKHTPLSQNGVPQQDPQCQLRQIKRHYFSVFDSALMGIAVYDMVNKEAIDCNRQFLDLFGFESKEEAFQYTPGELSPPLQPNGRKSQELVERLGERLLEKKELQFNWVHSKLSGETFHSVTAFIPLEDERPGLFFIIIKNIDEHIRDQQLLEQKNQELEQYIASNMQLESFAYKACHDLKEPLRTIGTFIQIIQQKHEKDLDDKSKEYMGFIVNSVTRMNSFVDGLFSYARIKENLHEFESFSLTRLLEVIQLDLGQTISEKGAQIQVEDIPEEIIANRPKVNQLFQNLISNALKFHSPETAPLIQITSHGTATHWHFSISDNGIGIDPKYIDQVFTLFRKLHSRDQYEGNGIGLALCKEIVEQHQGTIEVTSVLGVGTTFKFSLARKPNLVME